jgi:hypothetical protein
LSQSPARHRNRGSHYANGGKFGRCCLGTFVDEPLLLANAGPCKLPVTSIAPSDASFLAPEVDNLPLTTEAASAISAPIRFALAALGLATAIITVTSDDPASPGTIAIAGIAPPGKLSVPGSAVLGGVKCCQREQRRIAICNVGDYTLHVHRVALHAPPQALPAHQESVPGGRASRRMPPRCSSIPRGAAHW